MLLSLPDAPSFRIFILKGWEENLGGPSFVASSQRVGYRAERDRSCPSTINFRRVILSVAEESRRLPRHPYRQRASAAQMRVPQVSLLQTWDIVA